MRQMCVCTNLRLKCLKELLVVYSGHAADLLHLSLLFSMAVYEVCSDADGQLSPELLYFKT